jgi:hypothetical protein
MMWEEHYRNAREMVKRALKAREEIYEGSRAAKLRAEERGTREVDELQKWLTSAKFSSLVSDNQWNMQQSIMYNELAQTELLQGILLEQIKQTNRLQLLIEQTVNHRHGV